MKKLITLSILFLYTLGYSQIDYDTQIQPIFDANCVSCHSDGAAYFGGIELISYDNLMAGGYNTDNTNVLSILEDYVVTGYMPAWGADPLSEEEIALISQWISEGANPSNNAINDCSICGDADNNGIVDADDSDLIIAAALSDNLSTLTCLISSDVDGDGFVTITDGLLIIEPGYVFNCIYDEIEDGCTEEGTFYAIGSELFLNDCEYIYCEGVDNWSSIITLESCLNCTLSDGTNVSNGWSGNGTGNNWCNSCFCEDGVLSCTELDCEEGCWEEDEFYCIGCELFIDDCTYVECEGPNNWSDWMEMENCSCVLSDGSIVSNGWSGNGTGNNWCNSCSCNDGSLACTEMWCGEELGTCTDENGNEYYDGETWWIDECTYYECLDFTDDWPNGNNPEWIGPSISDDCEDCNEDVDGDGICDEVDDCIGTWVEDITTGSCYDINDQETCLSYGCSWTNEYTGVWLWEDVCGWQGSNTYEIDNSYCDDTIMSCNSDIDQDGICEDDCGDDMLMIIVDCECSWFNPYTYTVFFTTVEEESCTIIEDCACECINDVNENGICDEEEDIIDDCCINPEWIDDFAICPMVFDPVIGCDNMEYSNSCVAQASGLTSWTDQNGQETILDWDCNQPEWVDCGDLAEFLAYEFGGNNAQNLAEEMDSTNTNWFLDNGDFFLEGYNLTISDSFCGYVTETLEGSLPILEGFYFQYLTQIACCDDNACNPYPVPDCISIDLWDPVCGCDEVTYSNSADAACNNIFDYTEGECLTIDEGCWEDGEWYCIGCEIIVDGCNYYECLDNNQWSELITIPDCTLGDILGCTDEEACNYMNSATIDDNTCVYEGDSECEDCGTVLNFNNYGDNEYFSETYYAPPGVIITINFSGSTESCCDHIYVNGIQYNGVLDGTVIGDEVLQIEWSTDGSVNSNSGYGWSAELVCEEPIAGCTASYAENYNPDANTDDGSCILECTYLLTYDSYVDFNYDNSISNYYCNYYVSNGTYTIEQAESYGYNCDCVILGCTDPEAMNYDETAFVDDCSCIYEESCTIISVTGGSFPTEVSWEVENENGDIVLNGIAPYCDNFCFEDGCYTIHMNDSYGDGWNNAVLSIGNYDYTFTTGSYAIAPFGYNNDDCIIEGCTNALADNYDEEANYDDGSCEYSCEYLLTYESYQDLGFDNSISNYNCAYYLEMGWNTIEQMEDMGYNCDCVIVGCTDEAATNYDSEAFIDDCSCVYDNDCPSVSFNTTDTSLGWQINDINGETILEHNYNGNTQEFGSYCSNYCFEEGCYIINMSSMWGGGWFGNTLDIGESSFTLQTGYDGIQAFAYNTEVDCEVGCTDPSADNYNENAILDDGSCLVFGCTITIACNYNSDATAFDGSCYYCYMDDCNTYPSDFYDCDGNCMDEDQDGVCDWDEIEGCMDEEACNYNPDATENGSCEYPEQYYDCNGICLNDHDSDEVCNEIDNCPLIYNPDQADMNNDGIGDACDGISLEENSSFDWSISPNPFKNSTTVRVTNSKQGNYCIQIINVSGKEIFNATTSLEEYKIQSDFSPGYYIIQLESNGIIERKTLIIQ